MHLCIFKAACRIDWVLIVFPRVLEGSARGIDQSQMRPLALRAGQDRHSAVVRGKCEQKGRDEVKLEERSASLAGRRSHHWAVLENKVF